jgi:hypothetical protein
MPRSKFCKPGRGSSTSPRRPPPSQLQYHSLPLHHTHNGWSPRKEVQCACRYVNCTSRQPANGRWNSSLMEPRSPPHVAFLHLRYVERHTTDSREADRRARVWDLARRDIRVLQGGMWKVVLTATSRPRHPLRRKLRGKRHGNWLA